jgi:Ca2+:H+ antiporter
MTPQKTKSANKRNHDRSGAGPMGIQQALRSQVKQPLNWLLIAAPVAAALHWFHAGAIWVFVCSCIAILPFAGLMGRATENLAETLGAGIGGLLNATFGNAAELIIALLMLRRGEAMYPLVKASITGSIIGNSLLVLGLAIMLGGFRYPRQQFNRTWAGMGATLLALASIGLLVPTIFTYTTQEHRPIELLSEEIAVILIVIYLLSLVFSLGTHRHLFGGDEAEQQKTGGHHPEWGRGTSLWMLVIATAGVTWMAELMVGSVEHTAEALGMNKVFIGVIVVAVIGNAAEHSTAILVAMRNKMDLAVQIAVGSSLQVALLIAPVLVFASMLMGHQPPLDLHFTVLEMITVILAVGVLALVAQDGESHWMEGVMLLGVYVILALAFYHLPQEAIQTPAVP